MSKKLIERIIYFTGIILFTLLLSSFNLLKDDNHQLHNKPVYYDIETISGHEYIIVTKDTYNAGVGITHKQNCKYCK